MSRHTRALIVGATLAAMHLAGMTAAHAQAIDEPSSCRDASSGTDARHRQPSSVGT